jgi:hypothetical protein
MLREGLDNDAGQCDSDRYFIAWLKTATNRQLQLKYELVMIGWKRAAILRELNRNRMGRR